MKENKKLICCLLTQFVKETRAGEDVERITYYDDSQDAIIIWKSGSRRQVNCYADSGIAMIRDILRAI